MRNGSWDSIESEVHAELQIMNGSADSTESATSYEDGYRATNSEGSADTVESEVRAELQTSSGSADSVESGTRHDNGYRSCR